MRVFPAPLALVACALVGAAGGYVTLANVQPAASRAPVPQYRLIGSHAMLTKQGYARLRAQDGYAGSLPVGTKLLYGGGAVITHPRVYITFWHWTSDPAGAEAYIKGFFAGVGGSPWISSQNQYCQNVNATGISCAGGDMITSPANQLAGTWDDHGGIPANPLAEPSTGNSPPIADETLRSVAHFGYDPEGIYVIATPHGISTAGFAPNAGGVGYCAWHGALELADGSHVHFVNLPYQADAATSCGQDFVNPAPAGGLDGFSIVAGHEYAETITDPDVNLAGLQGSGAVGPGWYDPSPVGGEDGDKCAWPYQQQFVGALGLPGEAADIDLPTGSYAVQALWSNDANNYAGGCVITDAPPPAAAPPLPAIPGAVPVNPTAAACRGAEITDPAFDAIDPYVSLNVASTEQASLDILNVRFSTPSSSTLEITTTVDNLQPFPQGDVLAGTWSVYWDYGGQTYFASASADATGVQYADGIHVSAPTSTPIATFFGDSDVYGNTGDTGSFNPGPNGTIVIDVPLSHVGNPAPGAKLTNTWAASFGGLSNATSALPAPAVPVAGNQPLVFISDQAPDSNPGTGGKYTGWPYVVGSSTGCATARALPPPPAPPPAPSPPPIPLATNCTPAWTDPAGDEEVPPTGAIGQESGVDVTVSGVTTGQDPQLDLLAGYLSTSPDAKTLRLRLVIDDLSLSVAPTATDNLYDAYFTVKGTQYVASAQVDLLGNVTYKYGTPGLTATPTTTTGSMTLGPDGMVEIDVPLAGIGNPPLGTAVEHSGARAIAEYGKITFDSDNAAETSSLNFAGLAYMLSTAPCARAASAVKSAAAGHALSGTAPAAASALGKGSTPAAAGATASAAPAGGAAPAGSQAGTSLSGAKSHPGAAAPRATTPQNAASTARVPLFYGLAIVVLLVLGGLGWLVYRRRPIEE